MRTEKEQMLLDDAASDARAALAEAIDRVANCHRSVAEEAANDMVVRIDLLIEAKIAAVPIGPVTIRDPKPARNDGGR